MIRSHSLDHFLAALFVPATARAAAQAVYALDAELAHVRRHVSEPLIAHVRYAWWEESLAQIVTGEKPREHPVLQAIAPVAAQMPPALLIALVQAHREHYPQAPPPKALEAAMQSLLEHNCPQALPGWNKARAIITDHRSRFGARRSLWLQCKLLWAGL